LDISSTFSFEGAIQRRWTMRIQVLGSGCAKCTELAKRTENAVHLLGLEVAVEKVTDLREIMKFGIMMTPALAIDGTVKIAGRVPTEAEIQTVLTTVLS
jgi:small redox-active disulfide protein 2